MHIGIICPAGTGHINAMATLGCELMARGHEVTVLAPADAEKKVRPFGLNFHAVAEEVYPIGAMEQAYAELGALSGREAVNFTIDMYRRVTAGILDSAPGIIQDLGIEGMIVDQTYTAGGTVAERTGVPYVIVCAALLFHPDPNTPPGFTGWAYRDSPLGRMRNRIGNAVFDRMLRPTRKVVSDRRVEWGLPLKEGSELNSSDLAEICQIPREFDFPRRLARPQLHYVGPLHDLTSRPEVPFDYSRLDDRPLIYASMGSLQNRLIHTFEVIARATSGLGAQVVLSLGRTDAPIPENLPGAPIVVRYAPQLDLIEKASLVITHAGMNTTMESLACGVPMVAIPVTNDQPGVAARIAWTGSGRVLPVGKLDTHRLEPLLKEVLENPSFRNNAKRLQRAIHDAGGVPRAAEIVETALRERRTVRA